MVPVSETYGTANDGVIAVTLPYANAYPWAGKTERMSVRDTLIAADPYVNYGALDTNGNGSLDNTELHLVIIVRGFEEILRRDGRGVHAERVGPPLTRADGRLRLLHPRAGRGDGRRHGLQRRLHAGR